MFSHIVKCILSPHFNKHQLYLWQFFKQHSFVTLLSVCFGFLLYAASTPEFESSALARPARMLSLIPIAAVAWYIPHRLAKSTIDVERKLIFEESPAPTFELLRLGDYGR